MVIYNTVLANNWIKENKKMVQGSVTTSKLILTLTFVAPLFQTTKSEQSRPVGSRSQLANEIRFV